MRTMKSQIINKNASHTTEEVEMKCTNCMKGNGSEVEPQSHSVCKTSKC